MSRYGPAVSDIVFLGEIVNYIIENRRYFEEYVVNYTNAPCLIIKDFKDTDELDGLFSGWDPEKPIRQRLMAVPGNGSPRCRRRA